MASDFWSKFRNIDDLEKTMLIALVVMFIIFFMLMKRLPLPNMEIGPADVTPAETAPQLMMTAVNNPFILKFATAHNSNIKDGVFMHFTSQVPCWIKVLWAVQISDIYPVIFSAWVDFAQKFSSNDFLVGSYQQSEEMFEPSPVSDKILRWKMTEEEGGTFSLGSPPRSEYPLVVVVVDAASLEMADEDLIALQRVTSCITICHVSDELCPGESRIISQFIRTPTGRPYNLQPLYVSEENASTSVDDYLSSQESEPGQAGRTSSSLLVCVVCQTETVSRAILPCRHTALCDFCFNKMALCPICRGQINAYFTLSEMQT